MVRRIKMRSQLNLTLTQKIGSAIAVIGGSLFGLEAKADEVPEPKFIKGGYYAKDLPVYHSEGYPGHDYTGECKETVEKMQKSVEKPVWSRVNGPLVHRVGLHDGKIAHRQWITLNSDRYPIEVWTEKDGKLRQVLVDENGDGSFDVRISDSDNDGKLDKEEKIGGYVKRKTD